MEGDNIKINPVRFNKEFSTLVDDDFSRIFDGAKGSTPGCSTNVLCPSGIPNSSPNCILILQSSK